MQTPSPSVALAALGGAPQFYRFFPGFRGGFYKIWSCGAYELIVFASGEVAWLCLHAVQTDDGPSLAFVQERCQPITRAEYEEAVEQCLNWPGGGVLAMPAAQDWELHKWRKARALYRS